jgi:ABC-type lipoprotein export system ATPase subunit
MVEDKTYTRASARSVVQYFRIEGLYGYRTIAFNSDYAATVLIAKNGSGKTTLLAALDAFLKCQFSRLKELPFTRLSCKLAPFDFEVVLTLDEITKYTTNQAIETEARRLEVEVSALYLFLEEYAASTDRLSADDEFAVTIRSKHGYTLAQAQAACNKLVESLREHSSVVKDAWTTIQHALVNIEVVYLPTYRRIEFAVAPRQDRYGRIRRNVLGDAKPGLYSGDIQFGLSDVVERLKQLNQRIVLDSSLGYRELSASIINELIGGQFDRIVPNRDDIPDRAELELFFSRLKEDRSHRRYGPIVEVSIPKIEQIYSGVDGSISQESNKFLYYFLGKLNSVIQSTREIEALVRDFIANCNSYLSSSDVSTTLSDERISSPSLGEVESKVLTLSRRDLTISVDSVHARRKIPLNSLSSGEKQMISLFAKLYLYPPKEKLILIDEPELSLSIDWQRQILVDIVRAPSCRQVLAITHSPFIFDNALEPFARSLTSTIDPTIDLAIGDEVEESPNE